MHSECKICSGDKVIRLPLLRMAVMSVGDCSAPSIEADFRVYPCPECAAGDNVPFTRLYVMAEVKHGRASMASLGGYIHTLKKRIAIELAMGLLDLDMITFERGEDDPLHFEFPLRGSIGVVAKEDVATFEQRVNARQIEVAKMLIDETCEQIANWGSFYQGRSGGSVEKGQALRWLREAFNKVKERCGK